MGEQADYVVSQMVEGRWHCGTVNKVLKTKTCVKCGRKGLFWRKQKSGRWWLWEQDGHWHTCNDSCV